MSDKSADKIGDYLADGPQDKCTTAMICFAKQDYDFTVRLHQEIMNQPDVDRRVWADWEIKRTEPPANWIDTVHAYIENHDVFMIILSPDSIKSEICNWQIDHAVKHGKRIIPVVCRDVDYREVRKELSTLSWIFFRPDGDDFKAATQLLYKALDTDIQHARIHTKILIRALRWEKHEFEKSFLLQGRDLQRAQHWLSASALGKEPKPTTLHLSFIRAGQNMDENLKKRRLIALFFALIVTIGIIWPSWGVFFFALAFTHFFVYFSST